MVNGRILVLAASLMLAGTTVADEMQSIHIDINQVESSDELKPVDGLTSAGQPDAEEFALFAEAGYVAVVDLRGETEDRGLDEVAVLEGLGLEYVSLPLASPETINFDNASKLDEILSGFDGPVLVTVMVVVGVDGAPSVNVWRLSRALESPRSRALIGAVLQDGAN